MEKKFGIVEKQFEYRGHDCLVVFTHRGYRCGYVSVTEDKDFTDYDIDCHRGLSFSGELRYDYGQKAKFYIGFDCGHCGDGLDFDTAYKYGLIDAETRDRRKEVFSYSQGCGVWWLEYVEDQCRYIVDQLEYKKENKNGRQNRNRKN